MLDVVVQYRDDGAFAVLISLAGEASLSSLAFGHWTCSEAELVTRVNRIGGKDVSPSEPGMTTVYAVSNHLGGSFLAKPEGQSHTELYTRLEGTFEEHLHEVLSP
jgi:hypothetical protein